MKEAVGGLGITQIVIFFLILFSAYIAISINMNRAEKVKNEVISIIQKNNGFDSRALAQIQDYMSSVGYRSTGKCEGDWKGYGSASSMSSKSLFCIKEKELDGSTEFPKSAYYQVKVFFALDLPIFNDMFKLQLTGSTRRLYYPNTM